MVSEGDLLWQASEARKAGLNLTGFIQWLNARGHAFTGYADLYQWSVTDLAGFWQAVADHFQLITEGEATAVLTGEMPRTRWFPGLRLNYAEHVLRHETSGDPARPMLHAYSEARSPRILSWGEVAGQVRRLATAFRAMGLQPGDRIAAYLPNLPETVVAMLACTAIGAVWTSAAPEFGAQTVIDRFAQVAPRLVLAVNGYRYGGRDYDRTAELGRILDALPSVERLVMLDLLPQAKPIPRFAGEILHWHALLQTPEPAAFAYARVTSDHPLWVLFTSGTTGLPKAVTQGHHGILLEHYKSAAFHFELQPGGALFFYSTTGWMVWNTLMWGPLMNGRAVLYDGHPSHPDARLLWRIADQTGATVMGISPTYIQLVRQQAIAPGAEFALKALQSVMLVGSPSTPETFAWVLQAVKPDLWVASQSGGTEFCSGLLAGSPLLPTRAGEIQAPALGVAAAAFSDEGHPVIDQPGELVILKPLPSMPLFLWGDRDFARYAAAYFDLWPGIWRHGDRVRFNAQGAAHVLGRSDATLNRHGVRIGSAEIYRTMESIPGVADSLVLCIEDGRGGYWMPLFVQLAPGAVLDDALRAEIARRLREERSPRHVPDQILQAPEIPLTLTGKKMEVPIRKMFLGMPPEQAASRDATRNPAALDWFAALAAAR